MQTEILNNKNSIAKKLLALFIALIMIIGCMPFIAISVWAADEEDEEDEAKLEAERIKLFISTVYENPDEKLKDFGAKTVEHIEGTGKNAVTTWLPNGEPTLVKDGFELYYQYDTGEIAIKEIATGQILFSNPYDVGLAGSASSDEVKYKLLSQIIVRYSEADKFNFFYSFRDAAMNRQIKMKKIKGGIRVEYTLGKEEKRKLVPRMIERESFETKILELITNPRDLAKMEAYYTLKDANAEDLTDRAKKELQVTYPITRFYAIYVFDPNASERELNQIEGFIKLYTKYTFEQMDEDHNLVEYESKDKAPPLVKMSLEYYIDEQGLYMRLPANGIRFDESTYKIAYINVLPYLGAGQRGNTGYTFIPDGSGALMRYEDINDTAFIVTNKLYGPDFSFYKVGGGNHTRRWRMPVYGAVENYEIVRTTKVEPEEAYYDENGNRLEEPVTVTEVSEDADGNEVSELKTLYYDETGTQINSAKQIFVDEDGNEYEKVPEPEIEERWDGFVAIIEEGDVMAEITTEAGGSTNKYNSVSSMITPRPMDEYNLDFETKGINSLITVASRRKYAGNYIIRYIMLSSDENGNPKNPNGGYEATYVGMAKAYRQYLIDKGELVPMADDGTDIPLFIESLGIVKTAEYIFGFPYVGRTPLNTFDDIGTIIDELNEEGIYNLKFRLNGWMNDGLKGTAPMSVKVEKAMGGKQGFQDMLEYASQKGADIYPDLDFAMIWDWKMLDGFTPKKDLARYMDQIYSREKKYIYLFQDFGRMGGAYFLTAPERMDQMYTKAMKDYDKFEVGALSVVSLARELHSNHYKKSLVNRMDAKGYVTELFDKMYEDHGNLLADEANAYAFRYLDSIINVDLDSSRYMNQSEGVPFYAMVTHGCINIAGTPINMAGDYDYDLLKAIESGASPYFILCYQNANRLKEAWNWGLNSYYSVDYNMWLETMLDTYEIINSALKPVKSKQIIGHEFLALNVVKVTYEGGTSFILNYNSAETTVTDGSKEYVLEPMWFLKVS
ncbi:MAG: DUF5696 domain-containing protein [Oscillospiraceae bacterium]|nr:DUF5696 domain-containing protein [Oscillospiraceae bacterium]